VVNIQQRPFFAGRHHQHSLSASVSQQSVAQSVSWVSKRTSAQCQDEQLQNTRRRRIRPHGRLLALFARALSPTCDCVCVRSAACASLERNCDQRVQKSTVSFIYIFLSGIFWFGIFIWCVTPRKCASYHTHVGSVGLNISTGDSWMFYIKCGWVEIYKAKWRTANLCWVHAHLSLSRSLVCTHSRGAAKAISSAAALAKPAPQC
jgi:hypothetical protein